MSGYAKGTRKPRKGIETRGTGIGGLRIKPAVAIASLIVALYLVFLTGVNLGSGPDAILLSVFSFAMFAALAFLVRAGSLAGLKPFTLVIDALFALSTLSLVQAFAGLLGVFGAGTGFTPQRLAFVMSVNAVVATILVMGVMFFEKEDRENVYLKAAPLASGLVGYAILTFCAIVSLGLAYLLFGSAGFMLTALNILVFGLFGGVYEEMLFRGLLLSRLRQVIGDDYALLLQASAFAIFEALAVYAFFPNVWALPVVLLAGALLGYFFGMITIKNESVLTPQLIHSGLYMLLATSLLIL